MSGFSAIDQSPEPARLLKYLDDTAASLAGIKHYAAAAHALRRPQLPVLDVGCGAGHDVELLGTMGVAAIGLDHSEHVLTAARARNARVPLVRGDAARLPFLDHSFGGARVERVLMHVRDPRAVVKEIVRCVIPGSLITVFEPDWSTFVLHGPDGPEPSGWINSARHPAIGGQLEQLLEAEGCRVHDRVEERSVWRSLSDLRGAVVDLERAAAVAVTSGRATATGAEAWLATCQERDDAGTLRGTISKVLVVATAS